MATMRIKIETETITVGQVGTMMRIVTNVGIMSMTSTDMIEEEGSGIEAENMKEIGIRVDNETMLVGIVIGEIEVHKNTADIVRLTSARMGYHHHAIQPKNSSSSWEVAQTDWKYSRPS
jgi:hypothetical protein